MFLVDDIENIGMIEDTQKAIDTAQQVDSAVFVMRKVNYEGFDNQPYLFTNFRGACAMAMSTFNDNPYQAGLSMSEILNFVEHHFLEEIEQEFGMSKARRSKERRLDENIVKGGE